MSKNTILRSVAPMVAVLGLTACVGAVAPTVAVMPAPNKPPDVFQQDSADCQHYGDGLVTPIRTYTTTVPDANATVRQVLAMVSDAPSGSTYRYDGDRFAALTSVVEACTGVSYRVALARRILDRLGMSDSVPGQDLEAVTDAASAAFDLDRVSPGA